MTATESRPRGLTYFIEAWCRDRIRTRLSDCRGRSCHRRTPAWPRCHRSAATAHLSANLFRCPFGQPGVRRTSSRAGPVPRASVLSVWPTCLDLAVTCITRLATADGCLDGNGCRDLRVVEAESRAASRYAVIRALGTFPACSRELPTPSRAPAAADSCSATADRKETTGGTADVVCAWSVDLGLLRLTGGSSLPVRAARLARAAAFAVADLYSKARAGHVPCFSSRAERARVDPACARTALERVERRWRAAQVVARWMHCLVCETRRQNVKTR